MGVIKVRKVEVDGEELSFFTLFRSFKVRRNEIYGFKVGRILSLFDEIGVEIRGDQVFFVTEGIDGFFKVSDFLGFEKIFGPLWYRDAEDGKSLEHSWTRSE